MRVLALVSGGKDSCYAMMRCVRHGHQIVAIATLTPPSQKVDEEIDSYMFQSVATAHVEKIAQAMQLPFFKGKIHGAALSQQVEYKPSPGDEVEDLFALIQEARTSVPFDAVSSGAILSDYQRCRVENVCSRLGLHSLAFLWRKDQRALLHEMIESGVDAVIVKVASMGLEQRHLGRTIGELAPYFRNLYERFGFHECGEGGEYETFTRHCPLFVFGEIELLDTNVRIHSSGWPAVALLSVGEAQISDRERDDKWCERLITCDENAQVEEQIAAEAAEELAAQRLAELCAEQCVYKLHLDEAESDQLESDFDALKESPPISDWEVAQVGDELKYFVFGERSASSVTMSDNQDSVTITESVEIAKLQLRSALVSLRRVIKLHGMNTGHMLYVRMYLRCMSHYSELNSIYGEEMYSDDACEPRSPAARACVSLALNSSQNDSIHSIPWISLECLAASGCKRFLRVQSISEWAPRMIGPYCQLTLHGGVARVAGNLGFVPATMELADQGTLAECRAALSHCVAVLGAEGLSPGCARHILVYYVKSADLPCIRNCVYGWMHRYELDHRKLQVLFVRVLALPREAAVEVAMDAHKSTPVTTTSLVFENPKYILHSTLMVSRMSRQDAAEDENCRHFLNLQCLLSNSAKDMHRYPGSIDHIAVAMVLRTALKGMEAHFETGANEISWSMVRVFYPSSASGFSLSRALELALMDCGRTCPTLAMVPIEEVGNGLLSLQLMGETTSHS